MAVWRARVKLPLATDTAIRDFAIKNGKKLKNAVQEMIDDGIETIRKDGAAYVFTYPAIWDAGDCPEVEYVIDDSYKVEVDSLTASVTGKGKLGKALAEAILIGARLRRL